jgi:DNA-binding response OmpR family regulator
MPSVLVVDDDPPIRAMVQTLLKTHQFDVDVAATGSEALAKLAGKRYDAVVLDLMLPDVNGFEVLNHLDKDRVRCVVVISAAKEAEIDEAASHPSVRAALRKPFEIFELLKLVDECVRDRGAEAG